MKAIVVDDDEIVLQGLNTVIPWGGLGFDTVLSAKNGEEAYRKAAAAHPDVVVTDIRMPVMDGIELARKIHETSDNVSIIIMSAYEDFQYARSAMQYGVSDYILKPIDLEKIDQLVQRLTQIRDRKHAKSSVMRSIYGGDFEARISKDIREGCLDDIISFLDGQARRIAPAGIDMKELCLKLVDILFTYYKSIGLSLEPFCGSRSDVTAKLVELDDPEEICKAALGLFRDVFRFVEKEKASHEAMLAAAAKRMVEKEFTSSSLSLQDVADRIGVTSSRLSVLFRQAFGVNFSNYLAGLRIAKAQELLKDLSLKIEDIGGMVGYADSHYFAKVFKRAVNLTPSEYRNISGGTFRDS